MTQFDNTNRGVLFRNDQKEEGSNKPDYTGSLNVDGEEFYLDAWVKTSKAGRKFLSVSVKLKKSQSSRPARQATGGGDAPF